MFDNLPFIDPTPPQPIRWRAMAGLGFGLAVALAAWNAAAAPEAIFTSANHLRQIEVFSTAPATSFYLCNAGFHSRRQRRLIATLYGAQNWSVNWQGNDAAALHFEKTGTIVTNKQADFHLALMPRN